MRRAWAWTALMVMSAPLCDAARAQMVLEATHTAISTAGSSQAVDQSNTGSFTDTRDGTVYRWVRIGDQIWMAENIRFRSEAGSVCWNNDEAECATRGRFYNWETAMRIAPAGWHLPSEAEWQHLEARLGLTAEQIADTQLERGGDANTVASRLKQQGAWPTEHEGSPISITNDTKFSAVPTGFYALNEFTHDGHTAWWTSTEVGDKAWIHTVSFHDNKLRRATNKKEFFFPVRLVRDP
jgi:uncharacterized protein (TIGR02145 family)